MKDLAKISAKISAIRINLEISQTDRVGQLVLLEVKMRTKAVYLSGEFGERCAQYQYCRRRIKDYAKVWDGYLLVERMITER